MSSNVRLRFAPSPTGPLHIGGVRTALFSYLYARKHKGDFILRIEDTDRNRYVDGAEEYIESVLDWCGISPDESSSKGGKYGPYRQSERIETYQQYALKLVEKGLAYYAFDTKEEIEQMREIEEKKGNSNPKYGHGTRDNMKNSLSLPAEEVKNRLEANNPYVIRLRVPESRIIQVEDMIRGTVEMNTDELDDKVLLKQDGFPTYHLAVVVDDYLMQISHVFRGEEWLPSAPFHVLLWEALGWEEHIPMWAHLPLILKPEGSGKLSKRDGDKLGFPVFPLDWTSPDSGQISKGYESMGFLPEGFDNMLAMLGWHPSTDQEVFNMDELIETFDIKGVAHSGARFDYHKGVWYNQQHIAKLSPESFAMLCAQTFESQGWPDTDKYTSVPPLIQDRIALLPQIVEESDYFFIAPKEIDLASITKKWDTTITTFFEDLQKSLEPLEDFTEAEIEACFKKLMTSQGFKPGAVMLPFRVMLVGAKRGVGIFKIAEIIGKEDTLKRITYALELIHIKSTQS